MLKNGVFEDVLLFYHLEVSDLYAGIGYRVTVGRDWNEELKTNFKRKLLR